MIAHANTTGYTVATAVQNLPDELALPHPETCLNYFGNRWYGIFN
jgi:hypothetical protein